MAWLCAEWKGRNLGSSLDSISELQHGHGQIPSNSFMKLNFLLFTLWKIIPPLPLSQAPIWIQTDQRCQVPGECKGIRSAMVPQETLIVLENNHPSLFFLAPRPFTYLCKSQEVRPKPCSRPSMHSQVGSWRNLGRRESQILYGSRKAKSLF